MLGGFPTPRTAAIHCSQADSTAGGVCANGETDTLADEPGGYHGFKALFGAFQVNPFVTTGTYDGSQSGTFNPVFDVFAPTANNTGADAAIEHDLPADTTGGIPPSSFTDHEPTGTMGQTPTSASRISPRGGAPPAAWRANRLMSVSARGQSQRPRNTSPQAC